MNVNSLRRFFRLSCLHKEVPKKELLGTNEALKHFAKMWGDELKGDTMMMLAVVEQEYITNEVFTDKEIVAVKQVLGKVGLFFRDCKREWDRYEQELQKRNDH